MKILETENKTVINELETSWKINKYKETIYLAGPIAGCTDSQCHDWRNQVIKDLEYKYNILNPMVRDYRAIYANPTKIVTENLADIKKADIVLAKALSPSWDTAMEIALAHKMKKKVIIINNDPSISPWLVHHSDLIFVCLDDAINYLKYY